MNDEKDIENEGEDPPSSAADSGEAGEDPNDSDDIQKRPCPWEDVDAARQNENLQRRHSASKAKTRLAHEARPCPRCGATIERLSWFYFVSPPYTWDEQCGMAGWMTVCDPCHQQVDYFMEVIS